MSKKTSIPLAFKLYQVFSQAKKHLLFSVFGYVSHCKHTPSCGQYAVEVLREHGTISGTLKAFQRLLTCW